MGQDTEYRLSCDVFVDDGEYSWFPLFWQNGLYRRKHGSTIAEYMGSFPGLERDAVRLFNDAKNRNGKIIFVPGMADKIAIYDIARNSFEMIAFEKRPISPRKVWPQDGYWFRTVIVSGDNAFFMPLNYMGILKLDLNTNEMTVIDEWVNEVEGIVSAGNDEIYLAQGIISNGMGMFPFRCADAIMKFDIERESVQIISVGSGLDGYAGMIFDGQNYWLTPQRFDDILFWEGSGYKCKRIHVEYSNNFERAPFREPIIIDGYIYLFPIFCEKVFRIDIATQKMSEVKDLYYIFDSNDYKPQIGWDFVQDTAVYGEKVLFITGKDAVWHIYDTRTGESKHFCVFPDEAGKAELNSHFFEGNTAVVESKTVDLEDLIFYIKHKNAWSKGDEVKRERVICSEDQISTGAKILRSVIHD